MSFERLPLDLGDLSHRIHVTSRCAIGIVSGIGTETHNRIEANKAIAGAGNNIIVQVGGRRDTSNNSAGKGSLWGISKY